jgi:hypothetical protein
MQIATNAFADFGNIGWACIASWDCQATCVVRIGLNARAPCGTGGMDLAAADGPSSTALDLSVSVKQLEVLTMHALEPAASGADDTPLDAWLRHALRQAFGGTLFEPLPSDLRAMAAGQPQSRGLQVGGGNERRPGQTGVVRERR